MLEQSFDFEFKDKECAWYAYNSIKPEIGSVHQRRSNVKVILNGKKISVIVKAQDKVALNASIGSYKRLLELCKRLADHF